MELPDGWKWVKLGEMIQLTYGKGLRQDKRDSNGDIPVYGSNGIVGRHSTSLVKKPCIIVGRKGSAGSIHISRDPCWPIDTTYYIKPPNRIDLSYLYYILSSLHLDSFEKSTAIPGLNRNDVYKIKIPLPSLPTQKKIVAILEKAEELKRLREEADKWTGEFLQSVFLEMFGDPVKNEKGWELVKLKDLGSWQSGGTPSRRTQKYFYGTIPWYTSGELNSQFISKSHEKITHEAIRNSNAKLIQPKTLLLGMYDTAGLKSSITTVLSSCNQAIAYSELENGGANIFFVYFAIQIGREFFMSRQRGVRQKNLNLTMVKNINIPKPPLPLQNKFAIIVEKVEQMKGEQGKSKEEISNLFNAIMQKAFKGELVV